MPTTYRVTPAALADIEAIVDYLNEREPVAAVRFVEAVERTLEHIAHVPTAYPMFQTNRPQLVGVRWRPVGGSFANYLVFYRQAGDDVVDVVRVLHGAQDIRRLLGAE